MADECCLTANCWVGTKAVADAAMMAPRARENFIVMGGRTANYAEMKTGEGGEWRIGRRGHARGKEGLKMLAVCCCLSSIRGCQRSVSAKK